MDTLTQLENEVAFMRTGYNDSCTEYNARIQSFPDILLAKVFSFKTLDLIAR
jgi:LemA protein